MDEKSDFGKSVSRSSNLGLILQNEITPIIIKENEGIDPLILSEIFLPDVLHGISYDRASKDGKYVFWVFKAGPRLNKAAFQKHVGELLSLKKYYPDSRCGIIIGIGDSENSAIIEYIKAYKALWDVVYEVELKQNTYTLLSDARIKVDDTIKDISKEVLKCHINEEVELQEFNRYCSMPAITGSSELSVSAEIISRMSDGINQDITREFVFETYDYIYDKCLEQKVVSEDMKTFENGFNVEYVYQCIIRGFELLVSDYSHYKIVPMYVRRDWNNIQTLLKIGSGRGPAKYWDYYNPSEHLVEILVREHISEKGIKTNRIIGSPISYPIPSFFSDLGIRVGAHPYSYSEDIGIELPSGKTIAIQVKSLAGAKGGSGPKQAGYEAHRMSGLSLCVHWSYDNKNGEIIRKPLEKMVVLDGYWKGPKNYEEKSVRFMQEFGHARGVFFIDEVNQFKNKLYDIIYE